MIMAGSLGIAIPPPTKDPEPYTTVTTLIREEAEQTQRVFPEVTMGPMRLKSVTIGACRANVPTYHPLTFPPVVLDNQPIPGLMRSVPPARTLRHSIASEAPFLRSTNPVAAEAVLALGMTLLERPLPTLHVAGQAVLLQLDPVVGQIVRNGRIVVSGARQQRDENDNGKNQNDDDEVGFLKTELQSYASFSSSAMWRTSTSPRRPFWSWIMHAGQEVATTCAPLSRIAARLRSKIFCEVS